MRRSGVILGILLLNFWVVLGTLGFALIEDWTLLDAFYMAIITVSTVGFGEVHALSPAGRLFASFIIVVGLGTAFYTLTSVGQLILEGELARALGRRKMKSELAKLSGHYIVCGFDRLGRIVSEGLAHRGASFCVVNNDPSLEGELRGEGFFYVTGDPSDERILKEAGIERAKVLAALLTTDPDNLYLTLTAKGLNPNIVVVARASDEKAELNLQRGGADRVVSTDQSVGFRLLQAVVNPTVVEFMELVSSRRHLQLNLGETEVTSGSILEGRSLHEAAVRNRYEVIVIAIKKKSGEMVFNPDPVESIVVGDILVALGGEEELKEFGQACAC